MPKRLADLSDAFCIEAYNLNQRGEGPAMISGYGEICSYRTADAAINKGRRLAAAANKCKWFLLCDNPATTSLPHPILGTVPCCQRCADKVQALR